VFKLKKENELHVTTPNEAGVLGRVLSTLANAGINIRALNAYSAKEKGIFFLITSDNKKAEKCLKSLGFKVESHLVLTVLNEDRIGAWAEIAALLGNAIVDVDYCYGSSAGFGKAILVIRANDIKKAYETLR
jgi:hypothetical protein